MMLFYQPFYQIKWIVISAMLCHAMHPLPPFCPFCPSYTGAKPSSDVGVACRE